MTDFEDRLTAALRSSRRRRPGRRRPGASRTSSRRRPPSSYGAHLGRRGGRGRGCGRRCRAAGQPGRRHQPYARGRRVRPDDRGVALGPRRVVARPQRHGASRLGPRLPGRLVRRRRRPRRPGRGAARGRVDRHPVRAAERLRRAVLRRSAADLAYRAGQVWQYEKGDAEAAYPDGAWLGYQRAGTPATTWCGWSPPTAPPSRRSSSRSFATRASTPTAARRTPRMPAPTSPRAW